MRATSEFQWAPTRVGESHPAIANLVFCRRGYELIPFQLFGFPLFGMVLCR